MNVERPERVLIVGGGEDDRHRAAEQLDHLEAVQLRHLDVEEHQVWRELGHGLHGLETIAALGHDLDAWMRLQVFTDDRPRERLIVHHHDTE